MKNTQRLNKSEWIRAKDVSIPARDIVTLAQKEGIKLSLAQVYTARSSAKKKDGEKKPGRPAGTKNKVKSTDNGHGDIKNQFVQLAIRIGTDEAKRLLDRIEPTMV